MTTRKKGILRVASSVCSMWVGAYVSVEVIPPCDGTWWEQPYIITAILLALLNIALFVSGVISVLDPEFIEEKK